MPWQNFAAHPVELFIADGSTSSPQVSECGVRIENTSKENNPFTGLRSHRVKNCTAWNDAVATEQLSDTAESGVFLEAVGRQKQARSAVRANVPRCHLQ